MRFKLCEASDLDAAIEVIKSHTTINKIDTISTGLQAMHIDRLRDGVAGDQSNIPLLVVDDDGKILLVGLMRFAQTVKVLWTPFGYASELGRTKYGHAALSAVALEGTLVYAASRGYYDLYSTIRTARNKVTRDIYKSIPLLQEYIVEDLEVIEPYTHSKFELTRKYMMGGFSGKNPISLVLKRIYRPDKCDNHIS